MKEFHLGFSGKHYASAQTCAWRVAAGFLPAHPHHEKILVAPVDLKFQDPADQIVIYNELTGEKISL